MPRHRLSQKPQARWARKKRKAGLCAQCGKPRNRYKWLCDFHQGKVSAYMRRYRATKKAEAQLAPTV